MEKLSLYELHQLCQAHCEEAKQEWKRRWESEWPFMLDSQEKDGTIMTDKKTEINLQENKIYIVKNQQIIPIEPPPEGYGEQTFIWFKGEVDRVDVRSTQKIRTDKETL